MDVLKTDSSNPDFMALVELLDADLAQRVKAETEYYTQFNKIDMLKDYEFAYENGRPFSCDTFKPLKRISLLRLNACKCWKLKEVKV